MITPTSKAGTLKTKDKLLMNNKRKTGRIPKMGFTFVEVIIALTIASLSLLALLRLHLININMADTAEMTSQAAFLAEQKIEETLALDYPNTGENCGTVQRNNKVFNWRTQVTDFQLPYMYKRNTTGLRKISVDVNWKQGTGRKNLQMSTYVADRKLK